MSCYDIRNGVLGGISSSCSFVVCIAISHFPTPNLFSSPSSSPLDIMSIFSSPPFSLRCYYCSCCYYCLNLLTPGAWRRCSFFLLCPRVFDAHIHKIYDAFLGEIYPPPSPHPLACRLGSSSFWLSWSGPILFVCSLPT